MNKVVSASSFLVVLLLASVADASSPLRGGDQVERQLNGAWCGGHGAPSCDLCPWNPSPTANNKKWEAANWCNGECVWMDDKCVHKSEAPTNGFHEHLGECDGAVCSMWGDPHIITCDGLAYDCQARGLFTLMKNHVFDIQGHFVSVGAKEWAMVQGWGLKDGASITNDIMINYLVDDKEDGTPGKVPTMQFTFADLSRHDGNIASEEGCEHSKYYQPLDMPGQSRSVETLLSCRKRCEDTEGCEKFSFWEDGGCHITHDAATLETPGGWSRNVAGDLPSHCGEKIPKLDAKGLPIAEDFDKSKTIGNGRDNQTGPGCPILFYLDGELQDISKLEDNAYLYGDAKSDHSAQLVGYNEIHVVHKTESGATAEAMLKVDGNGPGELWSCHWNFWVCLPADEQDEFEKTTVGLFGSPDGNAQNDWMDSETGNALPLPHGKKNGREAFDYCRNNWCVSQEDSLMAYPTGQTYEDVKCEDEEYVDFNIDQEHCMLSSVKILEHCKHHPTLLQHSCHVDCCWGGCETFDEVAETVTELQTYVTEDEPNNVVIDVPDKPSLCDGDNKDSTGDTACPNYDGTIVKLLNGSDELPKDTDIIYGITLADYYQDENIGRTVKFRVASPFEKDADVYVRYEKKVGTYANNPECDSIENVSCDENSDEIEVGCVEFPGVDPFAIVDLYFVSKEDDFILSVAGDTEVEKCCKPPTYEDGHKVVRYAFEIKCTCPSPGDV